MVGAGITSMEQDESGMDYNIISSRKELLAVSEYKIVIFDFKMSRKILIPKSLLTAITKFDKILQKR